MIFTDAKCESLRTAVAEGRIRVNRETLARVRDKSTPKGDVLEAARIAGTMAAKRTFELIPFCHPIPLDGVSIEFTLEETEIRVKAVVKAIWKTGVEMEALTAASVALLTVYDMLKPLDREMEIVSVRVVEKSGGKSDRKEWIPEGLKAAVLVTSDGTYAGQRKDKSGQLILAKLRELGLSDVEYEVLPDDRAQIQQKLLRCVERGFGLVITTGGTGLGPRDVTVEATAAVLERELPGVAEAMRSYGQRRTPYAMLSRAIAGVRGETLIVNLPGSSKGTEESMAAVLPALFHSYRMMRGEKHE